MTNETSSAPRTQPAKKQRTTPHPSYQLAAEAVDAMLDKKAHDVTVLDLRGVTGVAAFFVIGTGDSDLQVRAIANSVLDRIRERYAERAWHKEGLDHLKWVLLDYVDVVVHVFSREKREHYDLERLWGEAIAETVPDEGNSEQVAVLQPEPPSRSAEND